MENIIKSLRKEKNLTQSQLAEIVHLDQTAISKWENGKAIPDTQILIRLAELFDVSTDYLLGRSTLYYPDRIKQNAELSPDGKKLFQMFNSLPKDLQHRVIAYTQNLLTISEEEESSRNIRGRK